MNPEQKKLVEENHNLIHSFLHRGKLSEADYYDLAAIGLCKAAEAYNPSKGYKFSTLAYRCMGNLIGKEFRDSKAKKRQGVVLSYDQIVTDDITFLDTMESAKNTENEVVSRITLRKLLSGMSPKQREVLCLLSQGYTQQEVAKLVNTSQSWVSRVRIEARRQLTN